MSLPDYWLTYRDGADWITMGMTLESGALVPITPRILGGGRTPQAALLRTLTPVRERYPSGDEAASALSRLRARRGISYRDAAAVLPISVDQLKTALAQHSESPDTYRVWASSLGISDADFRAELRRVQRERDGAADPV